MAHEEEPSEHKVHPSEETNGIVEEVFHLLWMRDPIFGKIPSIRIPDTVIIQYGSPVAWFFMGKIRNKEGQIIQMAVKKKNKQNLTWAKVYAAFKKKVPKCGIAATFYQKETAETKDQIVVHHFTPEGLVDFFENIGKIPDGVLQRFIQPKGKANQIIKSIWGPKLCLFEKIESIRDINNKAYDLYERAMLLEGKTYHTKNVPLRGYVLPNLLEKMCYNVAQHIQNVTMDACNISRMVLYFKMDEYSVIWFQHCSTLHLKEEPNEEKNGILDLNVKYRHPYYVKGTAISFGKPKELIRTVLCYNCDKIYSRDKAFELDYKSIIESQENENFAKLKIISNRPLPDKEGGDRKTSDSRFNSESEESEINSDDSIERAKPKRSFMIPKIIQALHPRLKEREYTFMKNNHVFLQNTVSVCEECFIHIMKHVALAGNTQLSKKKISILGQKFYGTGMLRPEVIRQRIKATFKEIKKKETEETNLKGKPFRKLQKKQSIDYGEEMKKLNRRGASQEDLPPNERSMKRKRGNIVLFPSSEEIEEAHMENNISLIDSDEDDDDDEEEENEMEELKHKESMLWEQIGFESSNNASNKKVLEEKGDHLHGRSRSQSQKNGQEMSKKHRRPNHLLDESSQGSSVKDFEGTPTDRKKPGEISPLFSVRNPSLPITKFSETPLCLKKPESKAPVAIMPMPLRKRGEEKSVPGGSSSVISLPKLKYLSSILETRDGSTHRESSSLGYEHIMNTAPDKVIGTVSYSKEKSLMFLHGRHGSVPEKEKFYPKTFKSSFGDIYKEEAAKSQRSSMVSKLPKMREVKKSQTHRPNY